MSPTIALDLPARVLVVGAGGGIGLAIATRLAGAGVEVLGSDRKPAPAAWVGKWTLADIADPAGRAAIAASAVDGIDGVVLAAGVLDASDWAQADDAEALRLLAVNLVGPGLLVRDLDRCLTDAASVVFVGSIAGMRASPKTPFYAASKAGLRNLAASLALLLQSRSIRVNVLAPGLIDTPLTDALNERLAAERGLSVEAVAADRAQAVPAGRAGTVDEMADACLFLLSRQSGYFTGSTLFATGGVFAGTI